MLIKYLKFIVIRPFTQRDYDRFGIKILEDNGFDVEVLSFAPLFYQAQAEYCDNLKIIEIASFSIFEQYIINHCYNVVYIKNYGESSKLLPINLVLSKYNVKTMLLNTNILPISINRQNTLYKLRYLLSSLSFKNIYQRIYYLINKHKVNYHNYVLIGGTMGKNCSGVHENTCFIYAHTLDYDIFMSQKNLPSLTHERYAVFLDENLPYHPDEHLTEMEDILRAHAFIYYQKLNLFFEFIESKYNLKIIIAAHPSAQYNTNENPFNDRICLQGKTNQLVQHAEFCIAHFSTSIHFAILHSKPLLFITMEEIDYLFGNFIEKFANKFNTKKLFIDKMQELDELNFTIRDETYPAYINAYIKDLQNHNIEGSTWEIVAHYFIENNLKEKLNA